MKLIKVFKIVNIEYYKLCKAFLLIKKALQLIVRFDKLYFKPIPLQ